MPHAFTRPARFSATEWDARVQLAAAYRIFAHLGWAELIYNHISLRVAGEPGHFLINPFGLHYSEVTASNLVKVDVQGCIVGHSDWPINPALRCVWTKASGLGRRGIAGLGARERGHYRLAQPTTHL